MIAIIDYNAGNLTSVKRALDFLGHKSVITSDFSTVINAERVIFPGVGAAGRAISDLRQRKLDRAIIEVFNLGRPVLGICLGTQIIMQRSQENNTVCLGLINGDVKLFSENFSEDGQPGRLKVPHMGWNSVRLNRPHCLFQGVDPSSEFYFVHSYYPVPDEPDKILGETSYGIQFASVITSKNLIAMQFHPEKSGRPGLRILDNFCRWNGSDYA